MTRATSTRSTTSAPRSTSTSVVRRPRNVAPYSPGSGRSAPPRSRCCAHEGDPPVKRHLLVAITLLVASGCAVVNPYVRANDTAVTGSRPTIEAAAKYAADTRQKYYDAIRDHTLFN